MAATGMETVAGGLDDPWLIYRRLQLMEKASSNVVNLYGPVAPPHNGHGTARIRLFLFVLGYFVQLCRRLTPLTQRLRRPENKPQLRQTTVSVPPQLHFPHGWPASASLLPKWLCRRSDAV